MSDEIDYSDYEFRWEPGVVWVHWELRYKLDAPRKLDGDPLTEPVGGGRSFTLAGARRKALESMVLHHNINDEVGSTLLSVPKVETGNELKRHVEARDLAERNV